MFGGVETAVAFALAGSNRDLGMLDAKATSVELQVAGRDFTILQSPGLLHSRRSGGTTGAVVWQTAIALADWISDKQNPLFARGILSPTSQVVELGCGVNPVLALTLSGRVARYIATDQDYVLKLYRANLAANTTATPTAGVTAGPQAKGGPGRRMAAGARDRQTQIQTSQLDWEIQDIARQAPWHEDGVGEDSADVVIACDCVYNEHIVPAFVLACKGVCELRAKEERASVVVVAQQLRSPEVYEVWARSMLTHFRMWKIGYDGHSEVLSEASGFAVHVAVLR